MPITLRGPDGQTIAADESKIAFWTNQGYRPISEDELGQELAARAARPTDRGFLGDVNAAVTSALGGITLGGSDVLLGNIMNRGQRERLLGDIEHAPVVAPVARIAGEVLPAFVTGGESLAARTLEATPAGQLARLSARVGEAIPGTGAAARVGRLVATGATEGAISNAGQYLGAMALQDKDASAEGFLASMRDGALYGGGAAGVLGIAGEGLVAARRLLPETELTPIAARRARETAVQEVSRAVDDTRELENVARSRARQIREDAIQRGMVTREELDRIAIQKAQDLADAHARKASAQAAEAEAKASAAQSKAEAAAARAERAKNPPKRTRGKKAESPVEEALPPGVDGSPVTVGDSVPPALQSAVPEVPTTPDDMIRKLQDTQNALDSGASLGDLSARRKETLVEDALNARVAEVHPEMERLLKHLSGMTEAREAVGAWLDKYPQGKVRSFEYAEGMRKQSGWRDVLPMDAQRPGFAEGSLAVPRGRQGEFIGDEAARQSYERGVMRRDLRRRIDDPLATAAEKEEAQSILAQMDAESAARKAKQIVEASDEQLAAAPATVDDHIDRALNGHDDLAADVDDASHAIGTLEQSAADLADELGPDAPPTAMERAQQFRQAQAGVDEAAAKNAEAAVGDADQAARMISTGDAPKKAAGMLSRASEAGQLLEALQMLGVPVPSASQLPVVGPLLSIYLKAKLAARAVGKLGGKVPRTAETEIARRAADTKGRLIRATDRALEGVGKAAASAKAAQASSVLSAKLFDDRDPATPEKKTKLTDDLQEIYLARRDELLRAMAPGAVREAVRKRVRTADAGIIDAITAIEERRLKAIYDAMPKVDDGVQILGRRTTRAPSRAAIEQWGKTVAALNRPAETLESILDGQIIDASAARALRDTYPRLVQDIQQRIVEKGVESDISLPFRRRIQLSSMLGIPLDDSQSPESAAFLSAQYQKQPIQPAQGSPAMPIDMRAPERVDPETRI